MRHALLVWSLAGAVACLAGLGLGACDDVASLSSEYVCMDDGCPCDKGSYCGGACTNLKIDSVNCGACGQGCGAGVRCEGGQCVCPVGKTLCGQSCVDTTTDVLHCGACARACPASGSGTVACVQSACRIACAAGSADCNNNVADGCETTIATDDASCGACGHSCGGAGCTDGVCNPTVLEAGLLDLSALTVDGNGSLYYATGAQGQVLRVAIAGGSAAVPLVSGETQPTALQVSGSDVVWLTPTSIQTVNLQNLNGGVSKTVLAAPALAVPALDLAMHGSLVFFVDARGAVGSVDVNAKVPAMLTMTSAALRLVADATSVYYIESGAVFSVAQKSPGAPRMLHATAALQSLATDGTNVFFAAVPAAMQGTVSSVNLDGSNYRLLAAARDQPARMVASSGQAYFIEAGTKQIIRVTPSVAGPTTLLPVALGTGSIDYLAVDALGLYYSVRDAGGKYSIYKTQR